MKTIQVGNLYFSFDKNGNLLLVGEVSLFIERENAKRIFFDEFLGDPNNGLFPMDAAVKKICLSVMPDGVARISLTEEQLSAIKKALLSK
jgi:hypothetical protein